MMKTIEVSAKAIQNEIGRRHNNKLRKAKGEPLAKAKAWYLPQLTEPEFKVILSGDGVTREFNSGNTYEFVLKG